MTPHDPAAPAHPPALPGARLGAVVADGAVEPRAAIAARSPGALNRRLHYEF